MNRQYGRRPSFGFGFGSGLTPAIRLLLAINISVFLIQKLAGPGAMESFFGLVPAKAIPRLHIWQFVTYMFLHGNFMHILLNMFMLWMFGRELEAIWGRRTFLQFYFFSGIGAAAVYCALMPVIEPITARIPLIGASGAVMGLLLAYGMMFPNRELLLYFFLPIKAKYMVAVFALIDLLGATQSGSNVGHLAHLGGLLFGWIFLAGGRRWVESLARWWTRTVRGKGFRVVGGGGSGRGGRGSGSGRPRGDGGGNGSGNGGAAPRNRIDKILEKISREGLQSLTEEEQEILRRASRKR